MNSSTAKLVRRQRRKLRVRKHVNGTSERPRLTVFRSHCNIYAQLIDDTAGRTLVAASSQDKQLREKFGNGGNKLAATAVGQELAVRATAAGIKKAVFDRNGYMYHGRIQELANAARKGGLKF